MGLRLKRDTAAFFGEWRRRAALQGQYRRVLGAAVARLINRTLASAMQWWRERAQWQVQHAQIESDGTHHAMTVTIPWSPWLPSTMITMARCTKLTP